MVRNFLKVNIFLLRPGLKDILREVVKIIRPFKGQVSYQGGGPCRYKNRFFCNIQNNIQHVLQKCFLNPFLRIAIFLVTPSLIAGSNENF